MSFVAFGFFLHRTFSSSTTVSSDVPSVSSTTTFSLSVQRCLLTSNRVVYKTTLLLSVQRCPLMFHLQNNIFTVSTTVSCGIPSVSSTNQHFHFQYNIHCCASMSSTKRLQTNTFTVSVIYIFRSCCFIARPFILP